MVRRSDERSHGSPLHRNHGLAAADAVGKSKEKRPARTRSHRSDLGPSKGRCAFGVRTQEYTTHLTAVRGGKMRQVTLGASGLRCGALGLGCMGMSEFYGPQDDATSLKTLDRALELGLTLYDTSDMYGRGHNEPLVGRFARGRRDKLIIASKFGVVRDPNGPSGSLYDREYDNSRRYMH